MGVKGLWELLAPCGHRVNVEQLGGKTVAVDVSIWLHQFVAAMRDARTGEVQAHAPCLGVFRRCLKLLFHGVRPVFVFDGATPALKKRTVDARRRRRDTQRLNLKRTAEKLLVNELKRRAVEEAARAKQGQADDGAMVSTLPAGASGSSAGKAPAGDAALAASLSAEADFAAAARFLDEDSEGEEGDVEDEGEHGEEEGWRRRYMSFSELQRGEMQRTGALPSGSSGMARAAAAARLAESLGGGVHSHPRKKRLAGGGAGPWADGDLDGELVDPAVLAALPPSLQLEVVDEARNRLRASMVGKYVAAAEQPEKFSSLQLDAFLKSSKLKRGLEVARETFNREQEAKELAEMKAAGRELPADVVAAQEDGGNEEGGAILVRRPVAGDKNASFVFTSTKATYRQREVAAEARLARTSASERDNGPSRRTGPVPGSGPGGNLRTGLTSSDSSSSDEVEDEINPCEISGENNTSGDDVEWEDADPEAAAVAPTDEEVSIDIKVELRSGGVQDKPGSYHDSLFSPDMFRAPTAPARIQRPTDVEPSQPIKVEKSDATAPMKCAETFASESSDDVVWEDEGDSQGGWADTGGGRSMPLGLAEGDAGGEDSEDDPSRSSLGDEEKLGASVEAKLDAGPVPQGDEESEPAVIQATLRTSDDAAGVGLTSDSSSDEDGVMWEEPPVATAATALQPAQNMTDAEQSSPPPPSPAQVVRPPSPVPQAIDEGERQAALDEMRASLEAEGLALRREQRRAAQQSEGVTAETYADVQELLTLFGIPFIVSPAEAEAQCAALNAQGLVDGVVTDDNDVFLFGARVVYRNLFDAKSHVERYEVEAFTTELGLSRARLIQLALLLGSDYSTGVHGVGVVNAMEILAAFRPFEAVTGKTIPDVSDDEYAAILRGLSAFRDWATDVSGLDLPGEAASAADDASWGALGEEFARKHRGGRRGWQFGDDFPSVQVVDAFRNPQCDVDLEGFEWGRPDVEALRIFCRTRFGWDAAALDAQLGPVLKKLDARVMQTRIDEFFFSQRFAKFASKRIAKAIQGFASGGQNSSGGMDTELLVTANALAAMEEDIESKGKLPLRGSKRPRTEVRGG